MKFPQNPWRCFCFLASLLIVASAVATEPGERSEPEHTNVVLILIDDLSHYGVTAYGDSKLRSQGRAFEDQVVPTPNIDALAKTGLRCDYAFATPLCENTRISLVSGMGNQRNYLQPKSQHESDITFGDTFQRAGYATGLFGKWKQSRGTVEVPGKDYIGRFGWDEHVAFDVTTEGQRFINPFLVVNGKIDNFTRRQDLDPATGRRWYGPDIASRAALDFIKRKRNEPFFLYYPMMLVHDEHKPTPDTRPKSIFDQFDEATNNRDGHRGDDHHFFPDMIRCTDKLIGKVVNQLDELGLRENTLVVVMGDNGTKESFAHVLPDGTVYPGRKGGNADNGLHVPLILNQPGTIPRAEDGLIRDYDGLVDLTDIYPTIATAAGVEIPNADNLDGISFWDQACGAGGEHRDSIYRWYIGNNTYRNNDQLLRFAFTKDFKRYAPSKNFPDGRFFDLRTDLLEREGDRFVQLRWKVKRYSGLDLAKLTSEQQAAYDKLGELIEANQIVPVEKIRLANSGTELHVTESQQLVATVEPASATRRGVVWESSDPAVATVNKFGEVSAYSAGTVTISAYSWHDAEPLAANRETSYRRDGVQDKIEVTVIE